MVSKKSKRLAPEENAKVKKHLNLLWKTAKGDKGEFTNLVRGDEFLKSIGQNWDNCDHKAERMGLYQRGENLNSRYWATKFEKEHPAAQKRLDELLADSVTSMQKILDDFKEFGIKDDNQLRNYARVKGIKIKKGKTEKQEKPEKPINVQDLILKRLKKGAWSIPEIARELDTSEEEAVRLIDSLYRKGHDVVHDRETKRVYLSSDLTQLDALHIDPSEDRKKEIFRHTRKIAVVHGTVLGSKYSNPTLLHTLYAEFEKREVDFVIHLGDVVTGNLGRKREGESFITDPEAQADYTLANYPRSKFFKTYMISGTRDLTFKSKKGAVINVIRRICSDDSRPDLIYRGDLSATFWVKGVRIEAINPGEDYAPYSKSYPLQNIITNLIGEEESLAPQAQTEDEAVIAVLGGSHVYDRIKSGNIHGILVPSLQSLTPYQKGKRKRGSGPVVGACIIELEFDDNWKLKSDRGRSGVRVRLFKLKKYQKKNDYRAEISVVSDLSEKAVKVLRFLDGQSRTEGEISRTFKLHKEKVQKTIEELQRHGYQILTPKDAEQADTKQFALKYGQASCFKPLPLKEIFVEKKKIGLCSDTHFGSQDQLCSLVKRFYEICDEEKVDAVFHGGDWSAGVFDHPANNHKVFIPGAEGQMRFLTDHYPKLKGNKQTFAVGGNHDAQHGSKKGIDVLKNLFMKNRPDIVYLGRDVGVTKLGKLNIELLHPAGGAGYALSYKGQNIIESTIRLNRARMIRDKIHLLALGNWHVYNEQVHSEAIVICVPCFQQQTDDYMTPKGLDPWIGGLICELVTDADGYVTEFASEFMDMAYMAQTPDFPDMPLSEFIKRYILAE